MATTACRRCPTRCLFCQVGQSALRRASSACQRSLSAERPSAGQAVATRAAGVALRLCGASLVARLACQVAAVRRLKHCPMHTAACCCSPCTLIHHWEAQPTQNWWARVGQRDASFPGRERATKLTRLCPGPTLLYELAPESRKHLPAPTGVHLARWAAPRWRS